MQIKATLLGLLFAVPAFATVRWSGDFETGNLSQWTKAQAVADDRIQIVTDRVREGRYAARFTVHQGDDPINASGNRNELVDTKYQPEGAEVYYGWSTLFDESFPSPKTWQLFAQWHQIEDYGSPPIQFVVNGEKIFLTVSPQQTTVWTAPLVRGKWHDFVLHVKFSNDKTKGFVELWYDGNRVLKKTYAETRANDYLKLGLYRNESIGPVGVVYQDGMKMGERLEEVMP